MIQIELSIFDVHWIGFNLKDPSLSPKRGWWWCFWVTVSGIFCSHDQTFNCFLNSIFVAWGKIVNDFEFYTVSNTRINHVWTHFGFCPFDLHWTFKWTCTNDRACRGWTRFLIEIHQAIAVSFVLQSFSCIIWFDVSILMNMNLINKTATIKKRQLWMSSHRKFTLPKIFTIQHFGYMIVEIRRLCQPEPPHFALKTLNFSFTYVNTAEPFAFL